MLKVLILAESVKSPKKVASTRKLGIKLRRILAMARKEGQPRKVKAIHKLMRQRADFIRSMFRD